MTLIVAPLEDIHVTSAYGVERETGDHEGVDLRAAEKTPVFAMGDGVVDDVAVEPRGANGKLVSIMDSTDGRYLYLHLHRVDVRVGQRVRAGQRVGLTGQTGRSRGPHLHLEYRPGATPRNRFTPTVDPMTVLSLLPPPSTVKGKGGGAALALAAVVLVGALS